MAICILISHSGAGGRYGIRKYAPFPFPLENFRGAYLFDQRTSLDINLFSMAQHIASVTVHQQRGRSENIIAKCDRTLPDHGAINHLLDKKDGPEQ